MSCSTMSTAAVELVADLAQQRPERLGLALGDAGRGLVEQDQLRLGRDLRGEVADPAGAGRQLGRCGRRPTASGRSGRGSRRPRAGVRRSVRRTHGAATMAETMPILWRWASATWIVSRTVRPAKRLASWKLRARPKAARKSGAQVDDLVAEDRAPTRASGRSTPGDDVHQRGLAGAVGADEPDDLAGAHDDVGLVEGDDAAEAHPDALHPQRQPRSVGSVARSSRAGRCRRRSASSAAGRRRPPIEVALPARLRPRRRCRSGSA